MRDQKSLSTIDNEIWLEKIQLVFSPERNLLKDQIALKMDFASQ
jgi:hypothetical protein